MNRHKGISSIFGGVSSRTFQNKTRPQGFSFYLIMYRKQFHRESFTPFFSETFFPRSFDVLAVDVVFEVCVFWCSSLRWPTSCKWKKKCGEKERRKERKKKRKKRRERVFAQPATAVWKYLMLRLVSVESGPSASMDQFCSHYGSLCVKSPLGCA